MAIEDVPRPAWADFLSSFCRRYQGWPVSLEVNGSSVASLKTPFLPLEDIEVKSQEGGQEIILIFLGKTFFHRWLSHIIVAPRQVRFEQTDWDASKTLTIHSAIGATTTLHVQTTTLPHWVNGGKEQSVPESSYKFL